MADRIKGITVEIGGDTTGLSKALSGVNKEIKSTQTQLKDVERLLKLDPGNVELLEQKQRLLSDAIEETETKLESLREAEKQVQEQFERGEVSQQQYDALQREIIATEQSLNSLRQQAKETEDAISGVDEKPVEEVGDAAKSASDDLEGMGKSIKGMALLEAADQLSAVADKIKEVGAAAIDVYNQEQEAATKVAAYFGETGEAAEESAQVIQDVYLSGVGDSMDTVADSVIAVKENLQDLDSTTLANITAQATKLEELYGIDINESMRGVNSLIVQFGLSAEEAMDYLVAGTQNGLDKTNELGDNLSEYAGAFAEAGYSAEEYFQLLNNGLEGGAYNLDKVNDAINEVTTRLADGTIADTMSSINEETGELVEGTGGWSEATEAVFAAWQSGSATQKDVIDSIVTDIQEAENQQDALNMAALAFGTMAEDGSLQFIRSLTSVGDTYEDVSGAAQDFYEQATTPSQELESNMRSLQDVLEPLGEMLMNVANQILPPIVTAVESFIGWFQSLPEPVQNFTLILGALMAVLLTVAPAIAAITLAVTALNVPLLPLIGIIAAVAAVIATVITVVQNWGAITDWISEKFGQFTTFLSDTWSALTEFVSGKWTEFTEFLSSAWESLTSTLSSAWDGFTGFIQSGIDNVIEFFNSLISFIAGTFSSAWSSAWNGVVSLFTSILNGLGSAAKGVFNTVIGAINGLISGINWVIRKINSISVDLPFGLGHIGFDIPEFSQIAYLARGGILTQGNAIVGEAGPELLTMSPRGAIVQPLTNNTTNNSLGGITVNVYGAPGQDISELADLVADRVEAAVQRQKAVWG